MLAIETTQRTGGVALHVPGQPHRVERFEPARRHDDRLMPTIAAVCADAALHPTDLAAISVSIGPGGFSGLRIGLTTAKLLARTTGAVLVGLPSALVVAAGTSLPAHVRRVAVLLATKREQGWLSVLERSDDASPWTLTAPVPSLAGPVDLAAIEVDALVADDHAPEAFLDVARRRDAPVIDPVFDPEACLGLGLDRWRDGRTDDPLTLAPIYPGPPEAVVRWDQLHGPS